VTGPGGLGGPGGPTTEPGGPAADPGTPGGPAAGPGGRNAADGRDATGGALRAPSPSRFRAALESGAFTVTAEISPPRGAATDAIRRKVTPLRDWVAAVNITDNQGSFARLSSLAGSLAALAAGAEPIMQLTCRDRNRIALQSELLSASALGIHNVLTMTGDHPRFGDHPDAKPVFDLDSVQLLWVARTMRDEGRLLSGRALKPPPSLYLGAVENPFAPPTGFRAARLGKKIAAGAQFVQTQYVFDVPAFADWMSQVRDLGLHERCHILAGVGPITSLRALSHLEHSVPGVHVPPDVARRLRGVPADATAREGVALCAETIAALRQIPGVAGVHVMAAGSESRIPAILEDAGLAPLAPGAPAGRAGTAGPAARVVTGADHAH
jgi:methylenetetrahydrofolate reductase (NADPH)